MNKNLINDWYAAQDALNLACTTIRATPEYISWESSLGVFIEEAESGIDLEGFSYEKLVELFLDFDDLELTHSILYAEHYN